MGSYRVGLFFTRTFPWKDPKPPPVVEAAFAKYAAGAPVMSSKQLQRFLHEFQGDPVSSSIVDAKRLIDQVHSRNEQARHGLTLGEFYQLLFSVELNPPIRDQVHHDMTAPISQYYIYTGHNSYLTGNQLSSLCSDVPIIKALQRGVRVIELDMRPNSAKDDINILHGRTVTTPVQLIKCLRSIKKHAFEASPYPVVITLEDHLTPDLQAKAAQMITATFGDMLFYPKSENVEEFPSPESLKYRILISTEPQHDHTHSKEENDLACIRPDDPWGSEVPDARSQVAFDDEVYDCGSDQEDADEKEVEPGYKRLITVALTKPHGRLEEALRINPNGVRCLNLSEGKILKAMKCHGTDVIRFTRRNLIRIYPKGSRIRSSNYYPFHGWMHGAQMVAFNMQGYGRPLWLMQGFFRANGGCGFVKKPDFLRLVDDVDFPYKRLPVKTKLKVTVYMGDGWQLDFAQTHFDTYSPPDFYVRVGIAGIYEDCAVKNTKIIYNDWTPIWNEEFTFPLTVPEMALLRVEVHEFDRFKKDDFGGQTCLPISELRTGIRAISLCDAMGEKYKATKLLMRFEFC